jgi:hypothetical protein
MRRVAILAALGSAVAWATFGDSFGWRDWLWRDAALPLWRMLLTQASSSRDAARPPLEATAPAAANEPSSRRLAVGPAQQADAGSVTEPVQAEIGPTASAVQAAAAPAQSSPAAPPAAIAYAPPPRVEDPLRDRAIAAGLHPDLSRAVLQRLSTTDFRNVETAIRTALAETRDAEVLYWPRQSKAGDARFQIHFVPGAESDCRRYVVSIAKDGWTTTALPVERCGIKPSARTRRG